VTGFQRGVVTTMCVDNPHRLGSGLESGVRESHSGQRRQKNRPLLRQKHGQQKRKRNGLPGLPAKSRTTRTLRSRAHCLAAASGRVREGRGDRQLVTPVVSDASARDQGCGAASLRPRGCDAAERRPLVAVQWEAARKPQRGMGQSRAGFWCVMFHFWIMLVR